MVLSEDAKTKLRETIERELEKVPEGTKIKLDNNLLDELIFFYGKFSKDADLKPGMSFKVPVWTGKFLSKIDLSGISFENAWLAYEWDMDEENIDQETLDKMKLVKRPGSDCERYDMPYVYYKKFTENAEDQIDFSNTNIKIDFQELFLSSAYNCNFSGVDLSNSNISSLTGISAVDLSNTNIKLDDIVNTMRNNDFGFCFDSNFSQNDFSNNTVDFHNMWGLKHYKDRSCTGNNYADTGLKITYNKPNIPQDYLSAFSQLRNTQHDTSMYHQLANFIGNYPKSEEYKTELHTLEIFKENLEKGFYVGCYINGLLINKNTRFEDIPSYDDYNKNIEKESREKEGYYLDNISNIISSQIDSGYQSEENSGKHM